MDHIGIDVHTKESQICILTEGGELLAQRIRTEPERFATVLGTHFNHPTVGRILRHGDTWRFVVLA